MKTEGAINRFKTKTEQRPVSVAEVLSPAEVNRADQLLAMEKTIANSQAQDIQALTETLDQQVPAINPKQQPIAERYASLRKQQQRQLWLAKTDNASMTSAEQIAKLEAQYPELALREKLSERRDQVLNDRRQSQAWADISHGTEADRQQVAKAGTERFDLRATYRLDDQARAWQAELSAASLEAETGKQQEHLKSLKTELQKATELSLDKLIDNVDELSPVALRLAGEEYAKQSAKLKQQLVKTHLSSQVVILLNKDLVAIDNHYAQQLKRLNRWLQVADNHEKTARLKAALRLFTWRQPEKVEAYLGQADEETKEALLIKSFWSQSDLADRHTGWPEEVYRDLKGLSDLTADNLEKLVNLSEAKKWRPQAKDREAIAYYCHELGHEDLQHLAAGLSSVAEAGRLHEVLRRLAANWQTPGFSYLAEEIADICLERQIADFEPEDWPQLETWFQALSASINKRGEMAPNWLKTLFDKVQQYSWLDNPDFKKFIKKGRLDEQLLNWQRQQKILIKPAE